LRLGEPLLIAAGRTPITPLADRALAEEVARGAGSYFEPVRETPGFANALHRLFGELRAASVTSAQLASAATDAKQRELAELYRRFVGTRVPFYDAGDAMAAPDAALLDDRAVLLRRPSGRSDSGVPSCRYTGKSPANGQLRNRRSGL
jgi:hypothetical protein